MECRPFKDPSFDLQRAELDMGIQAVQSVTDMEIQVCKLHSMKCCGVAFTNTITKAHFNHSSSTQEFIQNDNDIVHNHNTTEPVTVDVRLLMTFNIERCPLIHFPTKF